MNEVDSHQAKRFAPIVVRPSGRLTADKREIKDFSKLPSATSFIRKTLSAIGYDKNDFGLHAE
jgi:hypothetical protein